MTATPTPATPKRTKVSQSEFPIFPLQQALRIAQALWDNFAGKGAAPHDIAMAIDLSPTSGGWRNLCGSSIAYGLTEGGYNANQITLTDLGRRIVSPTEEGDDVAAKVVAMLQPRLEKAFFDKYNRAKFPPDHIGPNVLNQMGLEKERAVRAFEVLKQNGTFTGVIRTTKTGLFVALDSPVAPPPELTSEAGISGDAVDTLEDLGITDTPEASDETPRAGLAPPARAAVAKPQNDKPKQLFVAHGKNHKPLEDLKKILTEFKIPYKVAVDEANKGRPISAKVAELMNECSAGIFIFTKDEKFFREGKDGAHEEVWRPSENVVYELGAANIMWDRKIIIVREDGVNFPSDFSDLGYITFKDGDIGSRTLEIFKELIALELVEVRAV